MGVSKSFGGAYAKAQMAVNQSLPAKGMAFLSVNDNDKPALLTIARELEKLGFELMATRGTASYLSGEGLKVQTVYKVREGKPNVTNYIRNDQVDLIINTPLGKASSFDEAALRKAAVAYGVPYATTLSAASAMVSAIQSLQEGKLEVISLQELHASPAAPTGTGSKEVAS